MVTFMPRHPQKGKKPERKNRFSAGSFGLENNPIVLSDEKKEVFVPEIITVKEFAEKAELPVTKIITELMKSGVLATINETIDFETAAIIGDDLNLSVIKEEIKAKAIKENKVDMKDKKFKPRPPVVTVMGHVDHGKTSLLDKIRQAHVATGESGGITQHISAYQVEVSELKNKKKIKNRLVTFIDTPGHAAFSAIRTHGTVITDFVVLIVAADDGVMPQTEEVIEQAKINNVPIIVAINKIDLPNADKMKVMQQLSDKGLVPEEWGGEVVFVPISAKTGAGIDDLLEIILLQADLMELRANPDQNGVGVVIESHFQQGMGPMATVLVENGTLKVGDPVSIGSSFGKIRILEDFNGIKIKKATPSMPVRIAGLKSLPQFGERLLAYDGDKEARENALKSKNTSSVLHFASAKRVLDKEAKYVLNVVIKADVVGSLEAIKNSIYEIKHPDASVKIIADGVGAVSESDVTLALATKANIFAFRVNILGAAKKIAQKEKININSYQIIYELIDDIKLSLSEILPPEIVEEELGSGTILAIFRDDKKGFVAGGKIENGKALVGKEIKIFQGDDEKYRSKIISLRREKNEAREVETGYECGFGLPAGANVAVGDKFIVFETKEIKREIV